MQSMKNNITGAGIIFVSCEDPYSRLTRSISKCEYNAIGFYAPSNSTGVMKIIVTLVDLFGVEKPTWLNSGCTLDKLINNPLVTRIAIKPLKTTPDNEKAAQSKFRACICRGTETVKKPTPEEAIFSLFNYHPDNAKTIHSSTSQTHDELRVRSTRACTTGVDLVNHVITLYGAIDKIQTGTSISLSTLDEIKKLQETPDEISIIGMMGLPFAYDDDCVDISTYIVETNLFGDLVEISLPPRNPLQVEEEKRKLLNISKPYLIKGLSTFIDLILSCPDFFACVLKRFKSGKRFGETSEKILLETFVGFSDVMQETIAFLTDIQEKDGKIDERKLIEIRDRLEKEYYTINLYLGHDPNLTLISSNKKKEEEEEKRNRHLEELKSWLQDIITRVEGNDSYHHPTVINMAQLITIVNRLTNENFNVAQIKKTPAFLHWDVKTMKDNPDRYQLKSGKTIYLTCNSTNLDGLTQEELIEISKYLNYADERYDSLREAVAHHLTMLHDVSLA